MFIACDACICDYDDGNTFLHNAAKFGHLECVKYLSNYNYVDLSKQNNQGFTPLHYAAKFGHYDCLQYLSSKCNISIKNNDGQTPSDIALKTGHPQCANFIACHY